MPTRIASLLLAIAGALLLVEATGADTIENWIVVLSATAVSLLPLAPGVHSTSAATRRAIWALPLAVANLGFAALALRYFGGHNALLLHGFAVLIGTYVLRLLTLGHTGGLLRDALIANVLVTVALAFTMPRINGLSIVFDYLNHPTMIGLYSGAIGDGVLNEWSRRLYDSSDGQAVEVDLHVPTGRSRVGSVGVHLKTHPATEFPIRSVAPVSYVGFHGVALEEWAGEAHSLLTVSARGEAVALETRGDGVTIPAVFSQFWIDIPMELQGEKHDSLAVRGRAVLSAVLHWQFAWLLFLMLAPRRVST